MKVDGTDFNTIWVDLAPVALSNDYDDLDNLPDIPSDLSDLSDDTNILDGKQDKLTAGENVSIVNNEISVIDSQYTADDFDIKDLKDSTNLRSDWSGKQDKLDAGDNVTISGTTISAHDSKYESSDFDLKDLSDSTNLKATWNNKQDALGFTPEDVVNKAEDLTSNDNIHYPTTKAVNTELDRKVDKDGTKVLSDENFTTAMKSKLAGLESSHYRGLFSSLLDLTNGVIDPIPGDYADVDEGENEDVMRYIRDNDDTKWVAQGGSTGITAAQVKTLYESNLDTNAFTDDEKSKLLGIDAGAQKNVQSNWNEQDAGDDSFILNKPTDLKDFSDSTGLLFDGDYDSLDNKPTLGTMSAESKDNYYTKTETDNAKQNKLTA